MKKSDVFVVEIKCSLAFQRPKTAHFEQKSPILGQNPPKTNPKRHQNRGKKGLRSLNRWGAFTYYKMNPPQIEASSLVCCSYAPPGIIVFVTPSGCPSARLPYKDRTIAMNTAAASTNIPTANSAFSVAFSKSGSV